MVANELTKLKEEPSQQEKNPVLEKIKNEDKDEVLENGVNNIGLYGLSETNENSHHAREARNGDSYKFHPNNHGATALEDLSLLY